MYKKIDNNVFYVTKQKTPKYILVWIIILILGSIMLFLISYKYEYYKFDNYTGYIKKVDDFKLFIYLKEVEIESLFTSKIIIDKKEYDFNIDNISEDYYLVDNDNYRLVEITTNLDNKYLIENNVLNITLKKNKTTLLKEFKKGFKLWKD